MRRLAVALVLAVSSLALAVAPVSAATTTVSGSGSGTEIIAFGPSYITPPGAIDGFVDTGTYTSTGPLGNGTYFLTGGIVLGGSPFTATYSGTAAFTRSDGATLSGTMTGTAVVVVDPNQGQPYTFALDLTTGTGPLAGSHLDLTGSLTNLEFISGGIGSKNASTFTFTGTVVTKSTPPSWRACLDGGWRDFVDGHGRPFHNVFECVIWALLHHH